MKRTAFTLAAMMLAASGAYADPGNQGGGNGGCGVGQQTNGCGTIGGTGGQGGAGGNGYGVGIGTGGSVAGSGNSHSANTNVNANTNTIRNSNRNTNRQRQQQGQQQAAFATQGQSSRNDNRSGAYNTNSNANAGNNSAQSVTVAGDHYEAARIPVATAYAAPLTASNGTCLGSTSVGGQLAMVGLTVGTTWSDTSCDMRYDAEALRAAGQPAAAVARLCQKPEIAAAMLAAGTPCAGTRQIATAPAAVPAARDITVQELAVRYTGTDPIVRKRMGLPPLN